LSSTDTTLTLENERISVPELLFRPSDVGLAQAGIVEAIEQAVAACAEPLRAALYASPPSCAPTSTPTSSSTCSAPRCRAPPPGTAPPYLHVRATLRAWPSIVNAITRKVVKIFFCHKKKT
jgi:hypothetical protein